VKHLISSFICCLFVFAASAQNRNPKHQFFLGSGFAYASDVAYEEDMHRPFQFFSYQFRPKDKWYFGAELQYQTNGQLNNNRRLAPIQIEDAGLWYACRLPGSSNEMGFFLQPTSMQTSVSIVTSPSVFKAGFNQMAMFSEELTSNRVNLMLNTGRVWHVGKGNIEAGVNLTGTIYNRDVFKSATQVQPIPCRSLTTGEVFNTMFNVTSYRVVNEKTFWLGAGLHACYQYPITHNITVGLQLSSSMSFNGILLQAAPRVAIGF